MKTISGNLRGKSRDRIDEKLIEFQEKYRKIIRLLLSLVVSEQFSRVREKNIKNEKFESNFEKLQRKLSKFKELRWKN